MRLTYLLFLRVLHCLLRSPATVLLHAAAAILLPALRSPSAPQDTEFPGVVARPIGAFQSSTDYQYQTLRCNVDLLKIIQLGLSFCNSAGEFAPGCPTWQFNFKFSLEYVSRVQWMRRRGRAMLLLLDLPPLCHYLWPLCSHVRTLPEAARQIALATSRLFVAVSAVCSPFLSFFLSFFLTLLLLRWRASTAASAMSLSQGGHVRAGLDRSAYPVRHRFREE